MLSTFRVGSIRGSVPFGVESIRTKVLFYIGSVFLGSVGESTIRIQWSIYDL